METITIDGIDFSVKYGTAYAIFSGGDLIGEGRINMHRKDKVDVFIGYSDTSNFDTTIWPKLKAVLLQRLKDKLGKL